MAIINQKEYLKKYLSIGSEPGKKKKRKKKAAGISDRVKIIDDDIDVNIFNKAVEDDLYAMNEDAPQIVGVIDERPLELRIDDYRKSDKWRPVGSQSAENSSALQELIIRAGKRLSTTTVDDTVESKDNSTRGGSRDNSPVRKNKNRNVSPPRKSNKYDYSPPRRNRRVDDHDTSPSRKRLEKQELHWHQRSKRDDSKSSRREYSNDCESFKHSRDHQRNKYNVKECSPQRLCLRDDDASPPRKNKRRESSTADDVPRCNSRERSELSFNRRERNSSPPRRRKHKGDFSEQHSRKGKSMQNDRFSPPKRQRRNSDESPPRKNQRNGDESSARKSTKTYDESPPRKIKKTSSSERSPRRQDRRNEDITVHRKNRSRWDAGPSAQDIKAETGESINNATEKDKSPMLTDDNKMTKTLDGKAAGLQRADELVRETQVLKKLEDEMFKSLSAETSGANAVAIVRDRKTGKIRNFKKEAEEERKKKEAEDENKVKYAKWGKGLKQVEEHNEKVANELYEMSKPLARYADDEDLERHLKEQEREGDPMLAYMRKKKKKKEIVSGKPIKPQFEGEFMPNRYGIRPGHRWDGVDRSNGYEKKWFEVVNSRRAQQEEVYKWSTEDM